MGIKDKIKDHFNYREKLTNVWKQSKLDNEKIDSNPLTFKVNDPYNKQVRVTPFNKDFYKKPYGRSNKVKGVVRPGKKK